MSVPAAYFDGRQATRRAVQVDIRSGRVLVDGDGIARDEPVGAVEITEPLGRTARMIRFPDGAFCELADADAFAAILRANQLDAGPVSQWEGSLRPVAASALAVVLMLWIGYRYGLPAAAAFVADRLPAAAVDSLGGHVLSVLDRTVFAPSEVSERRQAELIIAFESLRLPGETPMWQHQIRFRKSGVLGPNAVALPSGEIVLTDAIVALAKDDRELMAVLAHEAGHVQRRHGVRHLLQNSVVALVITWYVGDVGTLAAAAPTAILQAKYSRDFEREADDYAVRSLRDNGIAVAHLADILRRLEQAHGGSSASYLSSHPATTERLERLRR